jgi:hypothetical protein
MCCPLVQWHGLGLYPTAAPQAGIKLGHDLAPNRKNKITTATTNASNGHSQVGFSDVRGKSTASFGSLVNITSIVPTAGASKMASGNLGEGYRIREKPNRVVPSIPDGGHCCEA